MSQKGQPGAGIDMFCRYFQTEPITVNHKLFLLLRKLGRGGGQVLPPKGGNMVRERRALHKATASNHSMGA